MRTGKQSKKLKDQIRILRKFLSGEDVVKDIYNGIEPITGIVFVHAVTGEKLGEERWTVGIDGIQWHESRTYPDPEINDIRYSSPNAIVDDFKPIVASEHSDFIESTENNEALETPENGSAKVVSKDQHRRLFLHGINEQMKQDKMRKDKMNQWSFMNGGNLKPF